jgi:hypothetical protein
MSAPKNHTALTAGEVQELLCLIAEKGGERTHFKGQRRSYWLHKLAELDDRTEQGFDNSKYAIYLSEMAEQPGFKEPSTPEEKDQFLQRMRTGVAELRKALRAFYEEYRPDAKAIPTVREEVWRLVWDFDRKAPAKDFSSEPAPLSSWLLEPLQSGSGDIAFYLPVNEQEAIPKRFAIFGDALREHCNGIEKRLRPRVLGRGETLTLAGCETALAIGPLRWNLAAMALLASAGLPLPHLPGAHGRVTRLAVGKTTVVIIEAEDAARASVLLRRVARGEGGVQRVGADGYVAVDLNTCAIVTG